MTDHLEDLISESEICLRDAYRRGFNQGENLGSKIPESRELLSGFISFIKKYRMVYTDSGVHFADGDNIYSQDIIVKNFLITYDYDSE